MFNYQLHYERLRKALEELWDISTDSSITEENKVKIIRDVSRATLDGEPTTADEYNEEEDVQLGYSIVKSNDEVEGVFIQEGKITQIDYNVGTCEHYFKTYQAEEKDTNIPESYTCDECGKELDIPEPDFDLMGKEK